MGSEFTQDQIERELKSIGANYERVDYESLINQTSDYLAKEKAT